MFVDKYEFGRIVVGGEEYRNDIVVGDDVIVESWWRREGHEVCLEDLEWLERVNPEVVIFGTGAYGRVKVRKEVLEFLKEKGVEVFVMPSSEAARTFNELKKKGKKAVLAIHLTC